MSGVCVLRADDAARMATLHKAAFPDGEAWDTRAFEDLLALATTHAYGIEADIGLKALLVLQVAVETAEILTLGVSPHLRRQGLAGDLLRGAARILGTKGVERFVLDVAADNARAISFYCAQGFSQDGVRKNYYKRLDGRRVDAMLLSRPIAGQQG